MVGKYVLASREIYLGLSHPSSATNAAANYGYVATVIERSHVLRD